MTKKEYRAMYTKDLVDFCDPCLPLYVWKDRIEELIEEYGEFAVMFTDSGMNNCQMVIEIEEEESK
jgi:hypothetical protein